MKMKYFLVILTVLGFERLVAQDFIEYNKADLSSTILGVGDFNNDGYDDVFGVQAFSSPDDIYLFLNPGDGSFDFRQTIISEDTDEISSNISLADYDNDGNLDALIGFGDDFKLVLFKNNGNNTFDTTSINLTGLDIHTFADVDSDGNLDIIGGNSDLDKVYLYLFESGSFSNVQTIDVENNFNDLKMGDMDDDGDLDLVIVSNLGSDNTLTILNNDQGMFSNPLKITPDIYRYEEMRLEDMNNDGTMDICILSDENVELFLQDEMGNFDYSYFQDYTGSSVRGYRSLDVLDLNGDDNLDIVFADSEGPINWIKSESLNPLTFSEPLLVGSAEDVFSIHHADFDLDGDMDLVAPLLNVWFFENTLKTSNTESFVDIPFEIFPNPVISELCIDGLEAGNYSYEVQNLFGISLKKGNLNGNAIATTDLTQGLYLLQIRDENTDQTSSKLFMKQ